MLYWGKINNTKWKRLLFSVQVNWIDKSVALKDEMRIGKNNSKVPFKEIFAAVVVSIINPQAMSNIVRVSV